MTASAKWTGVSHVTASVRAPPPWIIVAHICVCVCVCVSESPVFFSSLLLVLCQLLSFSLHLLQTSYTSAHKIHPSLSLAHKYTHYPFSRKKRAQAIQESRAEQSGVVSVAEVHHVGPKHLPPARDMREPNDGGPRPTKVKPFLFF